MRYYRLALSLSVKRMGTSIKIAHNLNGIFINNIYLPNIIPDFYFFLRRVRMDFCY